MGPRNKWWLAAGTAQTCRTNEDKTTPFEGFEEGKESKQVLNSGQRVSSLLISKRFLISNLQRPKYLILCGMITPVKRKGKRNPIPQMDNYFVVP